MTSDKKLVQPLSSGSKDSAERITIDSETLEEGGSFPHLHRGQELDQFSGKDTEELEVVKGERDTSHGGDVTSPGPTDPLLLPVHPASDHQQTTGSVLRQTRKHRLLVPIVMGIVVLLFALGVGNVLLMPLTQVKRAVGTLIYIYHTINQGIYPTYINGVAWSRDSTYVACGTGDGAVHVLQPAAQREVLVYEGHHGPVNNLVWFPDGKRIASAGGDHTVQIWEALTGHTISILTSTSSVWVVAVSPDGNFIAWAGGDGIVYVWQVSPRKHIFTYTRQANAGGIWGLAFSPDGARIASGDGTGVIEVWDSTDGGHVLTYRSHANQIFDLKWSPNGRYIASAGADGTVHVWNVSKGKTVYIHRYSAAPVQAVSWSPDGTRIASANGDGTVQLWEALDGGHLFVYNHHSGAVYTVAWSPNGSMIASGDESGSLQIWQAM